MKTTQGILLLILITFFSFQMEGQRNKAADGDIEFLNGGYSTAASLYKTALPKIKKIDEKGRVLFQLAECYRRINDLEASEEWYRKSITAKYYKTNPEVIYNFATALMNQGKYDEAIVQLNRYKEKGGNERSANTLIQVCDQAVEYIEMPPTRYLVENVVILNSKQFDFSPSFSSKKEDELVFSSSRPAATGSGNEDITGQSYMDLFQAKQDKKGKWSTPVPLGTTVNTQYSEGSTDFDRGKKNMYFTRCINRGNDRIGCDIYHAGKSGKNFQMAEQVVIVDRAENDTTDVGHPTFTSDNKSMVFASDLPGGFGGTDLWVVNYTKKGDSWSTPVNLGKDINSADDEMFPFIAEDGSLYFSSNGMGGLGGLDIFHAELTGELTWTDPKNMLYPINSSSQDFGIIFYKDENAGFFTSDRDGGKGKDDIYSFKMPPLVFSYVGTVYDDESGEPVANTKVVVVETPGGGSYDITTDGNGGFSLIGGEVKKENTYSMAISKDGYIATSGEFSTVGLSESADLIGEHFMIPIKEDKEYTMPLVLYPFNSAELKMDEGVNSEDSLNYLLDLMNDNPTFVIELQSHTDSRGSDPANMELSQRRAQTCVDYLVTKGIAIDRLNAKGKGETDLKISDAEIAALPTEEERELAHQQNRRTVFRIIRYDYVPK